VDVVPVVETTEELVMGMAGWVLAVLLVALMLPLLAFMYLDVLEAKHDVKQQLEKVEKLRREVERKNRDKEPANNDILDNPVFDRVRRPFSLSLPRPKKLGDS
jgi:uncharacterized membrane protein YgaE (UPF0421/DUF939 family)